jgi:hypothetical protein
MHRLTEVRLKSEVLLVELQVLNNLVSSGITRPTFGHAQTRQGGEGLRSVQMQTVVVPAPRCRNDVLGFHDLELPALPAKLGRDCQTSSRGPDHQSLRGSAHRQKVAGHQGFGRPGRRVVANLYYEFVIPAPA